MRIAALVKQVPDLEAFELDAAGTPDPARSRFVMSAYCRRAVAQAVELAAAVGDGHCTAITLGAPSGEDVLREAIAWANERNVVMDGILVHDPAFDGSDTLATAGALTAIIEREGPFDLVLVGRQSTDIGTGQVGPMVAELLDLPFATGARYLSMQSNRLHVRCKHEDAWVQMTMQLPAVVSTASGLIDPCTMPAKALAAVPAEWIRTLTASDLGAGPWGLDASAIVVDPHRAEPRNATHAAPTMVPAARGAIGPPIGVVLPDGDPDAMRVLLGCASLLAAGIDGHVVAFVTEMPVDAAQLGSWGADEVLSLVGTLVEEDVADEVSAWAAEATPWAILTASTATGREIAARAAAALGAGLASDAARLVIDDGRLVVWRTAYDGRAVAAVTATTELQMATVLTGSLTTLTPRDSIAAHTHAMTVEPRGRVRVVSRAPTAAPARS